MNRFAILKGIAPPPFKDDIAKEISETVAKHRDETPLPQRLTGEEQQRNITATMEHLARISSLMAGRFDPVAERQVNHMVDPVPGGGSLQYSVTQRVTMPARAHAMSQHAAVEDVFLTVRMPSGDEYRVGRDEVHIHQQRTPTGRASNYELHLNLPDNLASRILDELHHPDLRQSARNYELQRRRAEISRYISPRI